NLVQRIEPAGRAARTQRTVQHVRGPAERGGAERAVRLAEVRMVQYVEHVAAELHPDIVENRERSPQRQIELPCREAPERVPAERPLPSWRRHRERVR